MPAGRFYLDGIRLTSGAEIELPAEVAHQARDVLRLTTGNTLNLLDGLGGVYSAYLLVVERKRVIVQLGQREQMDAAEPAVRVVLCQGMLKAAKYETILQKGTELGVVAFLPLLSERAVAATEEAGESKRRRWAKIVAEAMEQCGGTHLPELLAPQTLTQALTELPTGTIALIPWEEEHTTSLRSALQMAFAGHESTSIREVRLFIGPEGGFSAQEVALAQQYGAIAVTLGPRILRAETAAIVAAALTLDALSQR